MWCALTLAVPAWARDGIDDPVLDELPGNQVTLDAQVQGVVLERGSGLPVQGVVRVGDRQVKIAPDGSFVLRIPSGRVTVAVESDEHLPGAFTEDVGPGQTLKVRYRVERYSWDDEVVVFGEGVREEVSRTVLSAEEATTMPGTLGDPVRAITTLPGVARTPLGGEIVVRGAEAINTATYVDGIPVPFLFHWFLGRSVVNPALLDEIAFYPGGMPARYGDSLQAVVDASLKDVPEARGVHGRLRADLLDGSAGITAAVGGWNLSAGGTWSWLPGVISVGTQIATGSWKESDYRAPSLRFQYADGSLRMARDVGNGRLILDYLAARDIMGLNPEAVDEDGDGKWDEPEIASNLPYDPTTFMRAWYHRARVRYRTESGKRTTDTSLIVGQDHQDSLFAGIGALGVTTAGPELGEVDNYSVRFTREDAVPVSDSVVLGLGGLLQAQRMRATSWRDAKPDVEPKPFTDLQLTAGPWVEPRITLGGTWLAPGFRLNTFHVNDVLTVSPEPRLSLRQKLDPRWTLTAFAGRFAQAPPGHRYAPELGDPDLAVMTAYQGSVGLEGRFASGVSADVSVYGTAMPGLTVQELDIQVVQPPPDPESGELYPGELTVVPGYRDTVGQAIGIEGMVRYQPNGPWFGWVGVTLSRTWRVVEGDRRAGRFDQPVSVVAVVARKLPHDWRLSGRWRFTSGQPFTPQSGVWNPEGGGWSGFEEAPMSGRLPVFHQLDLRVDKTWTGKRARYTFYIDVLNATNRKNMLFPAYNATYSRLKSQLFFPPILPVPGLEVRF